ncbi:MAG TPA: RNA methyltransferase [Solirubrobacteraceae bacterium]|jgi:TrmH family RNA methyltransferase|nr:RNA methyltransferase [Solirubrobacteraceae bacterium]
MTHISSPQNPRLKALKRLATRRERARSGRFAAEGEDLVDAAREAGCDALEGYRLAGCGLGGEGFHDVEADVLRTVSTLGSGTRVIGVYEQRWGAPVGPLCVYLHGVGDPGNVGTIVRSAHAFGASCVALGPGCADPHSPKALRASMGAIFAVALARVRDVAELPGERVALSADAEDVLAAGPDAGAAASPLTLLIGAERDGLPPELLDACERRARIPIAAESLNAAMAATVALYEVTRGRDGAPGSSRVRTR